MNESLKSVAESLDRSKGVLLQGLSRLGYYRWSKATQKLVSGNDEYRAILGLPGDGPRAAEEGVQPLLHPDDRDRVVQAYRAAEAAGRAVQLEFRIVRPDGAVRYLRDYNQPEPSAAGLPETWFGTIQDIS